MTLNIWHTISGLLIIICFISKVVVHYYLDYKHQKDINFLYSLFNPLQYFQKYKSPVDVRFEKLKQLCNLLLTFTFIAIIVNIFVGAGIYFNRNM
jgi:hypothetical protein